MTVSQTEALTAEVDRLREQVLDLGQAVTDMTVQAQEWKQAFVYAFTYAGAPVPDCLRDNGPELALIPGGAR